MSNKTYTVAGVSTLNGVVKPRFANDMDSRMFMLGYTGHTDIKLVNLPTEMSKLDAVLHLQSNSHFADEASQAALGAYVAKNTPKDAGKRGRPLKLPTLADVPLRGEKGVFLKREVREAMLAELIAEKISQHEAKKAKAAAKAAEQALVQDVADADEAEQTDVVAADVEATVEA